MELKYKKNIANLLVTTKGEVILDVFTWDDHQPFFDWLAVPKR